MREPRSERERAIWSPSFAAPLPVGVIATMLGVEDGDFVEFKRWSDTIFTDIGEILIGTPSPAAIAAGGEMSAYFMERIASHSRDTPERICCRISSTSTPKRGD